MLQHKTAVSKVEDLVIVTPRMCVRASVNSSKSTVCHAGMVKMSHVDDAINEMFQATHMQMMRNCCRLEKMLLASIHMESRAKGEPSTRCRDLHCFVTLELLSTSKLSHMRIGAQRDKHHCTAIYTVCKVDIATVLCACSAPILVGTWHGS